MAPDPLCHQGREAVAVHRQSPAGLHFGSVGTGEDQAPQAAQLLLEQSYSVFKLVGAQGIGAAQLREEIALMGWGLFLRLHFPESDGNAALGQLPGAFTAGQAGADDCYIHR